MSTGATAPDLARVEVPELHHHGVARMAGRRFLREILNWRLALVRVLTSGLAVVLTVVVLPGLELARKSVVLFLVIGVVFGLLNALVKPVLQFFTLRYLVASYGLIVVVVNALMLGALSWILGGEITSRGVLPYLFGGLLVGVLGLLLDTLFGTMPPILDRDEAGFDTESRGGASRAVPAAAAPAVPDAPALALPDVAATAGDADAPPEQVLAAAATVLTGEVEAAADPVPVVDPGTSDDGPAGDEEPRS